MPLRPLTPEEQAKATKLHKAIVTWSVNVEVEEKSDMLASEVAADILDNAGPDAEEVTWLDEVQDPVHPSGHGH